MSETVPKAFRAMYGEQMQAIATQEWIGGEQGTIWRASREAALEEAARVAEDHSPLGTGLQTRSGIAAAIRENARSK